MKISTFCCKRTFHNQDLTWHTHHKVDDTITHTHCISLSQTHTYTGSTFGWRHGWFDTDANGRRAAAALMQEADLTVASHCPGSSASPLHNRATGSGGGRHAHRLTGTAGVHNSSQLNVSKKWCVVSKFSNNSNILLLSDDNSQDFLFLECHRPRLPLLTLIVFTSLDLRRLTQLQPRTSRPRPSLTRQPSAPANSTIPELFVLWWTGNGFKQTQSDRKRKLDAPLPLGSKGRRQSRRRTSLASQRHTLQVQRNLCLPTRLSLLAI